MAFHLSHDEMTVQRDQIHCPRLHTELEIESRASFALYCAIPLLHALEQFNPQTKYNCELNCRIFDTKGSH